MCKLQKLQEAKATQLKKQCSELKEEKQNTVELLVKLLSIADIKHTKLQSEYAEAQQRLEERLRVAEEKCSKLEHDNQALLQQVTTMKRDQQVSKVGKILSFSVFLTSCYSRSCRFTLLLGTQKLQIQYCKLLQSSSYQHTKPKNVSTPMVVSALPDRPNTPSQD